MVLAWFSQFVRGVTGVEPDLCAERPNHATLSHGLRPIGGAHPWPRAVSRRGPYPHHDMQAWKSLKKPVIPFVAFPCSGRVPLSCIL